MEPSVRRVVPQKLGLHLNPVRMVLLYRDETQPDKLWKRVMPVRRLTIASDPSIKAEELRLRHLPHLQSVPAITVSKFIAIAQETLLGSATADAVQRVNARYSIDTQMDLNLVAEAELKHQKQLMEISFQRNNVDVKDPTFVYDKQLSFQPTQPSLWNET